MLLLASPLLWAAKDWNLSSSVSATTLYTSNLNLSANNEEDSFIFELRPSLGLDRQGARGQAAFDYRPRLLKHSSSDGDDRVDHLFNGFFSTELIEQRFFFDASASFSQQLIDNREASSGDSLNASRNFTDTATLQLSPRWQQRIGSYTEVNARLSYDAVLFDKVDDDSSGASYELSINTENSPSKLFWEARVGQSKSKPDQSDDIREDVANLRVSYRFTPQLTPSFNVGYVDNHLDTPTTDRASAGGFWGAGLFWRPNPRNSFDLTYNSRLQTNDRYGLVYRHRRRHSDWSFSYLESISSSRQELLQQIQVGSLVCPEGSFTFDQCAFVDNTSVPITGPGQQVIGVAVPRASLINERFIQRTASANVAVGKGKSRVSLGAFHTERDFQVREITERDEGVNVSWLWTPGRRTTMTTSWSWSRLETDGLDNDYIHNLRLALNRKLTPEVSLNGTVGAVSRSSPNDAREFEEVNAAVGVTKVF